MRTRAATLVLATLALWARPVVGDEAADGQTGAWDRSVALERRGQLAEAERVMVQAYGERPESYWAGLRLAYLALLQERYQEARSRYQTLRERPEADGDTDVVRGLASAVAGMGWERLKRGELAEARAEFKQALAIDPENRSAMSGLATIRDVPWILPEAWTGIAGHSLSRDQWTGWAGYAQLIMRFSEILSVRAAGRLVRYWSTGRRSPWAFSNSSGSSYTLDEEFLGVAHEGRWWGAELVGARSDTSESAAILDRASRLRMGRT